MLYHYHGNPVKGILGVTVCITVSVLVTVEAEVGRH
jgi:hypothetical protein